MSRSMEKSCSILFRNRNDRTDARPVAKKVIGVEIIPEAVKAAKENAKLNGLANCEFIAGDVLKVIDEIEEKRTISCSIRRVTASTESSGEDHPLRCAADGVYLLQTTSLARDLEVLQARAMR